MDPEGAQMYKCLVPTERLRAVEFQASTPLLLVILRSETEGTSRGLLAWNSTDTAWYACIIWVVVDIVSLPVLAVPIDSTRCLVSTLVLF